MNKKLLCLALLCVLVLTQYVHIAWANPPNSTDITQLVMDTVLEPASLDPAWANDIGSHEVIMNVYEPLLFFDRDYTLGPYSTGKVDEFVPKLATSWTEQVISETSPEGLHWVRRWTFSIRTGVLFHDNHLLTPEDVEYSFERLLVQDRIGGPAWMLYWPLLGMYRAVPPNVNPNWGHMIDHAIQSDATTVWFNLVHEFPSVTFKQVLSQTWSSIVNMDWCIDMGDFDGDWTNSWLYIWNTWHDPDISFIENDMCGTGPYKFSYWNQLVAWSIVRFEDYWDGWPAWKDEARTERIGGYVSTVTWCYLGEWATRKMRFCVGDSDVSYIDREYRDQILGTDRVRCYFHWEEPPDEEPSIVESSSSEITYHFPLLALDAFFFNFNIHPQSPYMGVSGGLPPGTFSENGIPPNIFTDINVRRGFAYAFRCDDYLSSVYLDEGERPSDPLLRGLPYDNPNQESYNRDDNLARYYLRLAWGGIDNNPPGGRDPNLVTSGLLWNNGMKFTIVYPYGFSGREAAADDLALWINLLHPSRRFHVDIQYLPWGAAFLPQMVAGWLPLFVTGYQCGFPDPQDFMQPFMHSLGTFASAQRYNNPTADNLIEQGISTPDDSARQQIYYDLQALYHNDVPSVPLIQPAGRQFERDWMRGWYYNPVYQGQYVYHRWKAVTHFGDANNDGAVNVLDGACISAHWSKPAPDSTLGPLGYNPMADLTGGEGGTTGSSYGPVAGISDGKVSVPDSAMVSAYWDAGPSHP